MRSLIIGLAAAATLAGLPAASAAATVSGGQAVSAAQLPNCSGKRVLRFPFHTREMLKAAYIHVFYDARTSTACAYLNSTNATWGTNKHMTITLKHCARRSDRYGQCIGQLQSTTVRGWYPGRSDTARLRVGRGCLMATARIWWGKNYGLTSTQSTVCVSNSGGA
ncbi:hypothetical protein [Nonomuraea cavernae]|uniref:Uncharacterized protein n=1 Tax=Nonomuraea cavernae TaxID=2045107 RepID=A0A917Z808_9ACTN|nr:hypothetical protein [Nonomuraea cavernae]MCA2189893.1 hypothetical protein [Nonomuraea cavernae]GGO77810.1 hypothetical protein GCM10012289_58340 [Nonomuraea cavernae]